MGTNNDPFRIASMRQTMQSWNEWLRRRIRMYIWKQWKKPKTKVTNLKRISNSPVLKCSITNERLARAGYFDILSKYESVRL